MKKAKRKNEHEKIHKNNIRKNKGITLIALAVTIIVIIIIASITTAVMVRR